MTNETLGQNPFATSLLARKSLAYKKDEKSGIRSSALESPSAIIDFRLGHSVALDWPFPARLLLRNVAGGYWIAYAEET